jgi:FlaG/FlaF family flagellin (archaellin)
VVLLVAITVVLAAVLYVLITGLVHGPGSIPIGSAFTVGQPHVETCTAVGGGCLAVGDLAETLVVEESTVTFASVLFEVATASGTAWPCGFGGTGSGAGTLCGFAVVVQNGSEVATSSSIAPGGPTVMSSGFASYTGVTGSSSLTSGVYKVVVDLSGAGSTGLGLSFVVIGQGAYSGTTSPVHLT